MRGLVPCLKNLMAGAAFCTALAIGAPAKAQQDRPVTSPILTLDSQRLVADSAAGQSLDDDLSAQSNALATENRRIEAELAEQEKDLTERRASMSPDDFRAEALAFDEKVQTIREEQDLKLRGLQEQYSVARQQILRAADPVLVSIMQESGAVIIMEKSSVLASLEAVDVTDLAILRLDRAMSGQPGVIGGFDTGTPDAPPSSDTSDSPAPDTPLSDPQPVPQSGDTPPSQTPTPQD